MGSGKGQSKRVKTTIVNNVIDPHAIFTPYQIEKYSLNFSIRGLNYDRFANYQGLSTDIMTIDYDIETHEEHNWAYEPPAPRSAWSHGASGFEEERYNPETIFVPEAINIKKNLYGDSNSILHNLVNRIDPNEYRMVFDGIQKYTATMNLRNNPNIATIAEAPDSYDVIINEPSEKGSGWAPDKAFFADNPNGELLANELAASLMTAERTDTAAWLNQQLNANYSNFELAFVNLKKIKVTPQEEAAYNTNTHVSGSHISLRNNAGALTHEYEKSANPICVVKKNADNTYQVIDGADFALNVKQRNTKGAGLVIVAS